MSGLWSIIRDGIYRPSIEPIEWAIFFLLEALTIAIEIGVILYLNPKDRVNLALAIVAANIATAIMGVLWYVFLLFAMV